MYERIRVLCKEFGYTIQTLEKMASISNGTIGKWQKSYPRADYLQRVAKVLNTTSSKDKSREKMLTFFESANATTHGV